MHAIEEEASKEAAQDPSQELEEDKMSDRSDLHNVEATATRAKVAPETDEEYEPSLGPDAPEDEVEDPYREEEEAGSSSLAIKVPLAPTDAERREHEISHLPYRSWCSDCIRGKGLTAAHRKRGGGEEDKKLRKPLVAIDYFYLGQDEQQSLPILAMVEEQTGRTYAICVPEKGIGHQYSVAAAAKMLKVSGCLGGILKSDTERPLVALRNKLQEMYPTLGSEDATKGESQSNGLIESYVGKIQAQARTMRSALERHYPGLHARHPVLTWMVDYAASLLSRFNRGADGMTPFERSTGRPWRARLPEFGEAVWFQPLKGERLKGKLEPRFEEAIYLDLQEGSVMKWVGNASGVQRCWTIKCKTGADRWNQEMMRDLVGLPWRLRPKVEESESEVRVPRAIEVELPPLALEEEPVPKPAEGRKRRYEPRGIYIRRNVELREFGYTPGCDGCDAARMELSHKHHSSACKARIREEMMKTEEGRRKVEALEKRAEEFIVKFKEAQDEAAALQQKRKEDGEGDIAEKRQKQTDSEERRLAGEREFEELVQEGNLPMLPSSESVLPDPLLAEEFAGRGDGSAEAPLEVDEEMVDEKPAMEIGSLEALCCRGAEDFQQHLHEVMFHETAELLRDEVVEAQRLKLQLGHISVYEAYGIDPMKKRPMIFEVFSPPRLSKYARDKGLVGGVALDLTTVDDEGQAWNFSKAEMREKAEKLVEELQPELILGCPPCGPFSILQNLNKGKMDAEKFAEKLGEAREHLRFCCKLYKGQLRRKKFFLHEHPDLATSWKEEPVEELLQMPEVLRIQGDMCRHGMVGADEYGGGAVKKRSGFMTNSEHIAEELNLFCENKPNELKVWKRIDFNAWRTQSLRKGGPKWSQVVRRVTFDVKSNGVVQDLQNFQQAAKSDLWVKFAEPKDVVTVFYYKEMDSKWHRHVQLMGGKAKKAEIYPEVLLHNILRGLKKEMKRKNPLSALDFGPVNEEPYFEEKALEGEDWSTFIDEVSGKALETSRVKTARAEELDYAARYNVWTLVPISEAWRETGKAPIGSRWIDIDKGDADHPNYRSRLVIQEVRMSGTEAIFAATPPLESIRFLLSLQRSRPGTKVMFIDIRRAHWTAKIDRLVFVRLPQEAIPENAEEPMCGRLNKAMYGCRDAARQWEAEITDFFVCHGFVPGLGSPVLFVNHERGIKVSVHGDDVTSPGFPEDLLWLKEKFLERYEIKYGGTLGGDATDVQDVMILNRLVHFGEFETTIEADPRHVQILLRELNLQDAKSVATPGVKCGRGDSEALTSTESSRYRSLVMRGCYLSLDRPDIAYACKELARAMSQPRQSDWHGLKRLGRYLRGAQRLIWRYADQVEQEGFTMFTDSDDAGCVQTRKSTSAGALMHGAHLIKFYSSTQHVLALSSGESEFYAGIKAGSTLLGAMSMALDLGEMKKGTLTFDATAAKAMLSRKGHGRAKHIDRSFLWLQQRVSNGDLQLDKVGTRKNGADLGTKHLDRAQIESLCAELNLHAAEGQHRLGLNV